MNDGKGGFAPAYKLMGIGAKRLAGAVDVDGERDLVAGRAVWFNRKTFQIDPQPSVGTNPNLLNKDTVVADIDRDGDPDVLTGTGTYYANDGQGGFVFGRAVRPDPPPGTLYRGPGYVVDADGDGDSDMILGHTQGLAFLGMRLLRNTGGGGFVDGGYAAAKGLNWNRNRSIYRFGEWGIFADVDRDGDQDLIQGTKVGLLTLEIWHNDGKGFFSKRAAFFGGVPLLTRDFDLDGNLDILAAYSGRLYVYFGNGKGSFVSGWSATTRFSPGLDTLAVADFNHDRKPDIAAIHHTTGGKVRVWLNQGLRAFSLTELPTLISPSSSRPARVHALDVNGDTHPDLIASPARYGSTWVFFGDGKGGFPSLTHQVLDVRWLADVDGDGDLDGLGTQVARLTGFHTPSQGHRVQYGAPLAGFGGMAPTLGERGPFRVGSAPETRITGARGGSLGVFVFGSRPAKVLNFPFPGLTIYATPDIIIALPLRGSWLTPGSGSLAIPYKVLPGMGGASLYKQAFVYDADAKSLFSHTNGLRIYYALR